MPHGQFIHAHRYVAEDESALPVRLNLLGTASEGHRGRAHRSVAERVRHGAQQTPVLHRSDAQSENHFLNRPGLEQDLRLVAGGVAELRPQRGAPDADGDAEDESTIGPGLTPQRPVQRILVF